MSDNATIRTRALSTGYVLRHGESVVSSRLDAALHAGELTCLLGPNGAGKSTLLRTLAGFQKPLHGAVEILGKPLADYTDRELARTVSVVLTDKPVLENMDVETLVSLGRAPYTGFWGRLSAADREAVDEALVLVGIEDMKSRMLHTLSDGERQKVMIAKAFAQATPVIFLDEPTAFLDFPSKVEIMQLLFSLSRKLQKTIFLSTHDLDLALQLADKVWLIDKRLGVVTGTPEDLSLSGSLADYFMRPGILFDDARGVFKVDVPATGAVRLLGSGIMADMARKALFRNGISAAADAGEVVVKADSERDLYIVGNTECRSVEDMLAALHASAPELFSGKIYNKGEEKLL